MNGNDIAVFIQEGIQILRLRKQVTILQCASYCQRFCHIRDHVIIIRTAGSRLFFKHQKSTCGDLRIPITDRSLFTKLHCVQYLHIRQLQLIRKINQLEQALWIQCPHVGISRHTIGCSQIFRYTVKNRFFLRLFCHAIQITVVRRHIDLNRPVIGIEIFTV